MRAQMSTMRKSRRLFITAIFIAVLVMSFWRSAETSSGELIRNQNSNSAVSDDSNTGTVVGNSNCKITVFKSMLDILKNSNSNLSGRENQLTLHNNSNVDVDGNLNNVVMKSCSNLKVDGQYNKYDFSDTSNLKASGNNNHLQFSDSSNVKVNGNWNNIKANHVANHEFKNVGHDKKISTNVVQIFARAINNDDLSFSVSYNIVYIKQAIIDKYNYHLGHFKFDMKKNVNKISVNIHNDEISNFAVTRETGTKVRIVGEKDGQQQSLEFVAPSTASINLVADSNPVRLDIDLAPHRM